MEVLHLKEFGQFEVKQGGMRAYLSYHISNGQLDVRHTYVPDGMRGQGVASFLVKAAYDYAKASGLTPVATCSYAVVWLERHPEYGGSASADYAGPDTCAL